MTAQETRDTIRQMLQDWNSATPEQRAEASTLAAKSATAVERAKVAVIRAAGYPMGAPAPLTLNCPCGARPVTALNGPVVVCGCGTRYTSNGWIISQ